MKVSSTMRGLSTPIMAQSTTQEPLLPSEQQVKGLLPCVLSRLDMLALFIAIVVWIPSPAAIQVSLGVGPVIYCFWILGLVTFLVPGAVVTAQLNRLMPAEGAIYVWTHRVLGPIWGFVAGFCAWLPGILVMHLGCNFIVTLVRGIYAQLWKREPDWLTLPWQQGIIVLGIFLFTGWVATLSLPLVMKVAKGIIALYAGAILIVGFAGVIWICRGHAPQIPLTFGQIRWDSESFALYGAIVLPLLGIEVPLNMSAETRQADAARLFLRWGPFLAVAAYMLGTFGVMTVVSSRQIMVIPYSPLIAITMVFGSSIATLIGVLFVSFFVVAMILYQVVFARILFVAALDSRLPTVLATTNRYAAPSRAITVQAIIILTLTLFTYFIGPFLFRQGEALFFSVIYNLVPAATTVIWCISMDMLFLDLFILLKRRHNASGVSNEQLIAPRWVLYLCCLVGGVASLLGIWTTIRVSWDHYLLSDTQWGITVGFLVFAFLFVGLICSAYPRLLGALEEQTARARENARLFENEVKRSKEQLETIFQNVVDGILVQDANMTIIFANKVAALLCGFPSVEALLHASAQCTDWVSRKFITEDEQGAPFPVEQFPGRRALREKKNIEEIVCYRDRETGQTGWLSIKAQAILNDDGDAQLAVIVLTDITERQELERRKNLFISMASHELKTPLTSLKGFTYGLQRRLTKLEDVQGLYYLNKMNAQLDRLTKLVSDLLDISKMQTGQLVYRTETFDVERLIRETVENVQEITPSHRIVIEGSVGAQVTGDKERLEQVLVNLLNNATKYSPHADRVLVHLSQDQGNLIVSVKDFGIGIEEIHHQKIFERFYQIADREEKTYPGLGIGLYLSHEIIKRHHGRIWVESKKGEGSTFSFTLPLCQKE
jgi:PAS domain S-box-containing protein